MAERELQIITNLEDNASSEIEGLQDTIGGMEDTFNSMAKWGTLAFSAIAGSIFEATRRAGNYADQISDASAQTQIAAETLQQFRFVADMAGVSTDTFTSSANTLTRQMGDLRDQTGNAYEAVESLGVQTHNANGDFREQGDIFQDIIFQLADMEDATLRNELATDLFRGQARQLIPVLERDSEEIRQLMGDADDLGAVLSGDSMESTNEFRESLVELSTVATSIGRTLGEVFAPALTSIADALIPVIQGINEFIQNNQTLAKVIATVALGISGVLAIVGAIGSAYYALAGASTILAAGKMVLATAIGAVSASMLAIPLAIMAVIAVVYLLIKNWETVGDFFKNLWDGIIDIFLSARDFISDIVGSIMGFPGKILEAYLGVMKQIPGFGGLVEAGMNVVGVNDAMITSGGDIVKFHPDDDILAMKDFGKLKGAGGGEKVVNLTVEFNGGYYLDRNAGRKIAQTLRDEFGKDNKIS